jgi:hypothetical protein
MWTTDLPEAPHDVSGGKDTGIVLALAAFSSTRCVVILYPESR